MANVNRGSDRTVNNPMVSDPVSSHRQRDNSPVNNADVDNSRMNRSRANNRASDNRDNNQEKDNPVNNRTDNSPDNRKAINHGTGSSRGNRSQASVNRDKLRADSLNLDSNPVNEDSRASSLKRVNVRRNHRSPDNGDSEAVLRDWLTTINPVGLSNQQVARTASSRRSAAKIFSTGPTACAMSRRWWTIPNCEPKPLASAIKPARSEQS